MPESVPCHVRSSGGICHCWRRANPINAASPRSTITSPGVGCFFLRFAMFFALSDSHRSGSHLFLSSFRQEKKMLQDKGDEPFCAPHVLLIPLAQMLLQDVL